MFQTNVVDKIETNILCSKNSPENCTVYEILRKNMAEPEESKDENIIRRIRKSYKHTFRGDIPIVLYKIIKYIGKI